MSGQKNELFWNCHMVTHNSPGITLSKVWTIWFPSNILTFRCLAFKRPGAHHSTISANKWCQFRKNKCVQGTHCDKRDPTNERCIKIIPLGGDCANLSENEICHCGNDGLCGDDNDSLCGVNNKCGILKKFNEVWILTYYTETWTINIEEKSDISSVRKVNLRPDPVNVILDPYPVNFRLDSQL